jgi:hypothetical protein
MNTSICRLNSSEVIERREDKIRAICSCVSRGITGGWLAGVWDIGGHDKIDDDPAVAIAGNASCAFEHGADSRFRQATACLGEIADDSFNDLAKFLI